MLNDNWLKTEDYLAQLCPECRKTVEYVRAHGHHFIICRACRTWQNLGPQIEAEPVMPQPMAEALIDEFIDERPFEFCLDQATFLPPGPGTHLCESVMRGEFDGATQTQLKEITERIAAMDHPYAMAALSHLRIY